MPTSTTPNIPLAYQVPRFPGLYWPVRPSAGEAQYLYYQVDIWRFTLYWTLISFGAVHLATAFWAVVCVGFGDLGKDGSTVNGSGARGRRGSKLPGEGEGGIEMQEQGRGRTRSRERFRPTTTTSTTASTATAETQDVTANNNPPSSKGRKTTKAWSLRWIWLIPLIYAVIGSIEATMAGSIVGAILGTIYQAGYFRMSTWTPLAWALINTLILILSGFSIQGGL